MTARQDCEHSPSNQYSYDRNGHQALSEALSLPSIHVSDSTLLDIELLSNGTYAPLTGFATRQEWACIVDGMRLPNGTVWPVPITLPVSEAEALSLCDGQEVSLCAPTGRVHATLHINEVFPYNKLREAECVYGTANENHPGVKQLYEREEYCVSGPITAIFDTTRNTGVRPGGPAEARALLRVHGWQTVMGILIHERCRDQVKDMIESSLVARTDGMVIQVVPDSNQPFLTDGTRETCHAIEQVLHNANVHNVVVLPYPAPVRHAGARERLMQALIQRNFGCTHFSIARTQCLDNWSDVQLMCRQIDMQSLGIQPIFG